jgi:fructokinase
MKNSERKIFGGIEAGGTKFICAVGDNSGEIIAKARFPTLMPDETMAEVVNFFKEQQKKYDLAAIGIASFGPLVLDRASPSYGYVYAEQKMGWGSVNMVGIIKDAFGLPVGFDTDVNGAVLAEHRLGAGKGFDTIAYWTVGTGIGAGIVCAGNVMHGLIHPEMGHVFVPQDKIKDPFEGVCSYHKNCLEGLASGPALQERWKVKSAMDLPKGHQAWDLEAEYLGGAMANCILNVSPQRIILGGGVMQHEPLYPMVRTKTVELLNGFIKHPAILENIDEYIVPPALEGNAGALGALILAEIAYEEANKN